MYKKYFINLAVCLLFFGMIGTANATLIGDEVTAQHYWTNLSSPYANLGQKTVAEGTSDMMYPHNGTWYTVNVEANSIIVDYDVAIYSWHWSVTDFNGLVVDSLNDSSGNAITGVSIETNLVGWNASQLSFDADTVNFNWSGLSFTRDSYFIATLDFTSELDQPTSVPEPATLMLLGLGLIGLAGVRRKFKK